MFVINNEILSKQNLPEHWAWFQKKVKALKQDKRYYTISAFKNHRYEKDDSGRKIRMKRYKLIPTSSTFENKEMGETQTWIYVPSANSIRNENGVIRILSPKPFMVSEATVYDVEKDAEIIFFLLFVSESIKNKKIFLIDYEAENIKKANESAIASEAQYLIFNSQSPIHESNLGTDEVYRQLGIAYGIPSAEAMHLAELKNKLWSMLLSLNNGSKHPKVNYENFIKDCYNSTDTEYRSTILLAVERKVIYFDRGGWWIKVRGEYDELIVRVPTNDVTNRNDILTNYLMQHREYMAVVREAIDNSSNRLLPVEQKLPTVQLKKTSRKDMMSELQEWGWNYKELMGKKNPELIQMIKDNRRPSKVST